MDFLTSVPHYGGWFLLIITVLVFVHELGHFWIARRSGVRVEVFSIGFGPELFGFNDRAGTRWKFSALPLGGYVKMFGESDRVVEPDGRERPMTETEKQQSFFHKRLGQRAAIVAGGPLANFLFAIVVLAVIFATYGQQFSSNEVGFIEPGSAAEAAGIKPGDRIVRLDGQTIHRFEDIVPIVSLGLSQPLDIVIERNGERLSLTAKPKIVVQTDRFGNSHEIGKLGIGSKGVGEVVRYNPLKATWVAAQEIYRMTVGTLQAVWQMIIGVRSTDELGGIVRIAKMSGDVAQIGIMSVIGFSVMLSVNLGLINLFPVPMLDGGHLAFYAAEAIRGRPLGPRAQEWGFRLGFALVLSLMIFATWNDLVSLKVVAYIKGLIT